MRTAALWVKVWICFGICIGLCNAGVWGTVSTAEAFPIDSDETRSGDLIWYIHTKQKLIAITFDDGPHPLHTPAILDVLKQFNAHATFFVIGERILRYPDVIKRQLAEGHEIANHTFTHRASGRYSAEELAQELQQTNAAFGEISGGKRMTLFRPVEGRVTKQIVETAVAQGYKVVLWYKDSRDWNNPGVHRIVNNVLAKANAGDILLFHDSGSGHRRQTIASLKKIIPKLQVQGYELVTISELLERSAIPEALQP